MRQYKYTYTNSDNLRSDLASLKVTLSSFPHSSMMFRVYSEVMDRDLIMDVLNTIDSEFPGVICNGCTTAANVSNGELAKGDILVVCTVFEDPTSKVYAIHIDPTETHRGDVVRMVDQLVSDNPWMKTVELVSTMVSMSADSFRYVLNHISKYLYIFGGGAINRQIDVSENWIFSTERGIFTNGVLATVYGGDNLEIYSKTIVGWRPLGRDFMVTKAVGNTLCTLDDMPAFEVYSRYLKIDNNETFLNNSMEFPILCKTATGSEALRTGMVCNDDGSVDFASNVEEFVSARLTYGSQDNILIDAHAAAKDMINFGPEIINVYSCFGRKNFLGENCTIDIEQFAGICDLSGFFTSGELVTDETGACLHHNETLVVVGIKEGFPKNTESFVPRSEKRNNTVSLNSRLVNFIGEATQELQDANAQLADLVKEVENQKMEADLANRAKSEFLANMSHEIRTPINAILGFDTMILRETGEENISKYAIDIHNASENLLSIINDILDLSKVESGKMEILPTKYELSSLINDTMNMIMLKGADKGLDVNLSVSQNIPAWYYGDDVRIRQILINLLNNAVKYTEKGSISLKISGTRDGNDEILHFSIEDTGIGIKPEDMDALFETYKRVEESRNRNIEGTGLGMSITIKLLKLMDSHLMVESTYGEGSVFYFDLRQKIMDETPIGDVQTRVSNQSTIHTYKSTFAAEEARLLVVDDNSLNRKVIISLLKNICTNIDEADGGFNAIALTEKKQYDLIFLDHMMPDLDGIETYRRMMESDTNLNKDTPTIMLTANAISGAKEEYLACGFHDFLSKPVDPSKLEAMLKKYLPAALITNSEKKENAVVSQEAALPEDFPEIDGIEIEYAYKRLLSKDLVESTMVSFAKSGKSDAATLSKMRDSIAAASDEDSLAKAIKDYEIKVHSMKSAAAMIGGLLVSSEARALEKAAKRGDASMIKYVTDTFLDEWNTLVDNIFAAFPCNTSVEEYDKEAFVSALQALDSALNNMDLDTADDMMEKISSTDYPDSVSEKITLLEGAVANIDIVAVTDLVNEIIGLL